MGSLLRAYGFEIIECDGATATRDNIVAALQQLVVDTAPEDAVVVYYSGHARRTPIPDFEPNDAVPAAVEHLCPSDYGASADKRFVGISAGELSLIFSHMRSANVTALFDCCYGNQLGRGDEPNVEWPQFSYKMLADYFGALRAADPDFDKLTLEGNTKLVRVAASAEESLVDPLPPQAALDALNIQCGRTDEYIGAMTSALVQLLAPLRGRRVSWRQLVPELRSRLPSQRAEIGGPAERVPFSLEVVDATTYRVALDGDGAVLDAGLLLGVSPGDVYTAVPPGQPEVQLAALTIDDATATQATARIEWLTDKHELPAACVAIPVTRASPRHPVRVEAPPELQQTIGEAIAKSPLLRVAGPLDADPVAVLEVNGDSIVLGDGVGPLFPPAPYPAFLPAAVLDATNLATERRLHALQGSLMSKLDIQLGVVRSGAFVALAGDRPLLAETEHLALRLENRGDETRYVNAFDVSLRRAITLLEPSKKLEPAATTILGVVANTGVLEGYEVSWPDGLPRDRARGETVLLVATRHPVDLSLLETSEHLPVARDAETPLQELFRHAVSGQPRGGVPEPFAMMWVDFTVLPFAGTTNIGKPAIDESSPDARLFARAGAPIELHIDKVFAGVRVDVLVCTGDPEQPYFAASPAAGTLWRGTPAAEIFIWTSTSTEKRSLDQLLHIDPAIVAALRVPHLAAGASLVIAGAARAAIDAVAHDVTLAYRGLIQSGPAPARLLEAKQITFSIGRGD